MQVVHPVAKLATNASGAIWWPLQQFQEVLLKSISNYSSLEIYSSYGLITLGLLLCNVHVPMFIYLLTNLLVFKIYNQAFEKKIKQKSSATCWRKPHPFIPIATLFVDLQLGLFHFL